MAKLRQLDPNGITWHAMSGYPRLENLATNPSFEATSGTVDIWKNLATNPSFEAVAPGTTTLRTNLCTNPSLGAGSDGWTHQWPTTYGGSCTSAYNSGGGAVGAGFYRMTVLSAPTVMSNPGWVLMPGIPVTAGVTYTVSAWVRSSVTRDFRVNLVTPNGTDEKYGSAVTATPNVWTKAHCTYTPNTSGTLQLRMRPLSGDVPLFSVGETFDVDGCLAEQTDQLRPYFDGSTPDALGWDYGWTGAANASTSTAKAAPAEVRRNLATNPSFEATDGVVEVRRNYALNPFGAGAAISGYGQQTVTANVPITGHPEGFTTATRIAYNSGQPTPGIVFNNSTSVSTQYTVSAWIYHETTAGGAFGFAQSGVVSGPNIAPTSTGTWERRSWTFTSHASITSSIGYRLDGSATGSGSYLITGILLEKSPNLNTVFSGATPAAGDFTYLWVGTANASESVQQGLRVATVAATQINYRSVYGSKYRLAISPLGTTSDSFASPGGDTGGWRLGMSAGKTYTALATIDVPAAQTGSLSTRTRRIVAFFRDANGEYQNILSTAGSTTGVTTIRHTFTIPSTATEAFIRLYNGSGVQGEVVYWSDFLLIEGTYTGPYFDGSTPSSGDFTHAWTGAANASASIQQGVGVQGVSIESKVKVHRTYSDTLMVRVSDTSGGGGRSIVPAFNFVANQQYTIRMRARKLGSDTRHRLAGYISIPLNLTNNFEDRYYTFSQATTGGIFIENPAVENEGLEIENFMILEGTYTGPYFDGSTAAQTDFTYAWLGIDHGSQSVQRAIKVSGWGTGVLGHAQSTEWADSGGKSLRLISYGASNNLNYGDYLIGTTLEVGKTYTAIAKSRIAEPLLNASTSARKLAMRFYNGSTADATGVGSNASSNTTGEAVHYLTFVVPAGTTSTVIRLSGSYGGDKDVWWDSLLIVEGERPHVDYLDGSFPEDVGYIYSWSGAAHGSTSIALPK